MTDGIAIISDDQRQGLEELTGSCNERLVQAGAQGAEQSFSLGCALGGLPLVGGVLLLYVLGVFSFILAFFAFLLGALVLLGITAFISLNAKKHSIAEIYRKEVGPEIQAYLARCATAFGLGADALWPTESWREVPVESVLGARVSF